jgi:adenylyltransferase/sulfurtransferase
MTGSPSDNLARYHRQMLLPGFGEDGQRRLLASSALIVGCGALGCVTADALARAGVGRLFLVDRDIVESTNLQRQILYDEADARDGTPKAAAAARRLRAVNSGIAIEPVIADLNSRNVEKLIRSLGPLSVVVDGTDNFQTRYLLNDACVKLNAPLVYGGVVGTAGMNMTILPGQTPCLRCVFPEPPAPGSSPTCDTAGVLGPMVSLVAATQAAEALKVLLGRRDLIRPVLQQFDAWNNQRHSIDLSGLDRSQCPCCARRQFAFLEGEHADAGTTSLCGSHSIQVLPGTPAFLDLRTLATRLAPHGAFTVTEHLLRGRLASDSDSARANQVPIELTVFRDGRAIIKGIDDPSQARSIYARFVGA